MNGITAAVVGALAGSVVVIAVRTIIDIPTFIIALVTILILLKFRKIKEPQIILAAAIAGLILKLLIL